MDESQLEKFSIDQLYDWVNKQYQAFADGKIAEDVYQKYLDYYKTRLASDEGSNQTSSVDEPVTSSVDEPVTSSVDTSKVRSTSIAGLRKKLLEEIRGND